VAEPQSDYALLSPQELEKTMQQLEEQMYQHAQNLEFEEAAAKRDQLDVLKKQFIANS
jgi:excinuclease ABC subunit B